MRNFNIPVHEIIQYLSLASLPTYGTGDTTHNTGVLQNYCNYKSEITVLYLLHDFLSNITVTLPV